MSASATPPPPQTPTLLGYYPGSTANSSVVNDFGAFSPNTIKAGSFQFQTGVDLSYREWDTRFGVQRTSRQWTLGDTWVTYGVTKDLEFQAGIPLWQLNRDGFRTDLLKDHQSDTTFGNNVTLRGRYNLWGNDGGRTSLGLLGTVVLPTGSCDSYEYGLAAAFSYRTTCNADMRFSTGFMLMENRDNGWNPAYDNRLSISHSIIGGLSGLVAFDARISTERRTEWSTSVEAGLFYNFTPVDQLFGGSSFHTSGRTPDFGPTVSYIHQF